MSENDWERFEDLVLHVAETVQSPTQARANGIVLSKLIESASRASVTPGPLEWMDWERQKILRLLRSAV